jgi:hypothetical protein
VSAQNRFVKFGHISGPVRKNGRHKFGLPNMRASTHTQPSILAAPNASTCTQETSGNRLVRSQRPRKLAGLGLLWGAPWS